MKRARKKSIKPTANQPTNNKNNKIYMHHIRVLTERTDTHIFEKKKNKKTRRKNENNIALAHHTPGGGE